MSPVAPGLKREDSAESDDQIERWTTVHRVDFLDGQYLLDFHKSGRMVGVAVAVSAYLGA